MFFFCLVCVVSYILWQALRRRWRTRPCANDAIIVTGCDTGFGAGIVDAILKQTDATVIAGYVTPEGGKKLKSLGERVTAVQMDVTKPEEVEAAFEVLAKSGKQLRGLVNNAGIGVYGFCEALPMERFEKNMQVNVIGAIRTTKLALPWLRASKGRLVTMGSCGGRFPSAFGSAYIPTKAAILSFQDCVRQEVYRFGVRCSIVEPGFFATGMLHRSAKIGETDCTQKKPDESEDILKAYGSYKDKMTKTEGTVAAIENLNGGEKGPDFVVDAVMDGLTAVFPKTHYLCGWDANIAGRLAPFIPGWVLDLVQTYLV